MYHFSLDVATALEFYRRCSIFCVDTEEERVELLVKMANEGYPISIGNTQRSKTKYLKDLAKEYKILHVKPSSDTETSNS